MIKLPWMRTKKGPFANKLHSVMLFSRGSLGLLANLIELKTHSDPVRENQLQALSLSRSKECGYLISSSFSSLEGM